MTYKASDSTLIQGLGGTPITLTAPLGVLTVQHGLRYRIRFFNIVCSPNYVFQIDSHANITVIEADGIPTQPYTVDQIAIFAGQRYSFILNADQAVGNYWIRAARTKSFAGRINFTILRYVDATDEHQRVCRSEHARECTILSFTSLLTTLPPV
ncbi:Laccase protein [Mycena venus]|uniref:laccase n=1 Tax=Mycena venus TaxID=2733690 RepID=A0A8H6X7T0_9AGAR|nr:Laccase protein [Mycena venus]